MPGLSTNGDSINTPHEKSNSNEHELPIYTTIDDYNTRVKIYYDNNGSTKGSGVAIIISAQFSIHVIKTHQFKGRVLTLDLAFKKKITYVLSTLICQQVQRQKSHLFDTHLRQQSDTPRITSEFHIVLLGDLNVNLDGIKKSKTKCPKWKLIKNIIKHYNLIDIIKKFHNPALYTWSQTNDIQASISTNNSVIFMDDH